MTDHLPECIWAPQHFDPEQNIVWEGKPCICEELRACKQRVLDAAREAIASLDSTGVIYEADVLAAIDALRLKP